MNVFDALGLTEGEKRVYQSLISLGSTTTGPLYKSAGVSQSKVYEVLERLKKKGLVSSINKQGIMYWQPANPSLYLEKITQDLKQLEERKKILEKQLPFLLKEENATRDEAQVLFGYNGFRASLYSLLDSFTRDEEFVVFGSPHPIPEPYRSFLKMFNTKRIQRGIKARFLYGESLRSFAKEMYSIPKTRVRYLKGLTPSTLAIGKDRIIIMVWENGGKCVVISGKEIAKNYRIFFESLWKMAKD